MYANLRVLHRLLEHAIIGNGFTPQTKEMADALIEGLCASNNYIFLSSEFDTNNGHLKIQVRPVGKINEIHILPVSVE